jgi:hypothetical protein
VRPAAERFDADHPFAVGADQRLIDQLKLVPIDGGTEVMLQALAQREIRAHGRIVEARAIAALVLGPVERHVGEAHDVGCVPCFPVDQHHSHAGADNQRLRADDEGGAQAADDALGEFLERRPGFRVARQHGEFIAPEPGHEVVFPHDAAQAIRYRRDEFVADVVAEGVVDVLEVIEVDRQQ